MSSNAAHSVWVIHCTSTHDPAGSGDSQPLGDRIEIDADAVRAHGVNLYRLVQRLRGENVSDISGGFVHEGDKKYYVRTMARFQSLDEYLAEGHMKAGQRGR